MPRAKAQAGDTAQFQVFGKFTDAEGKLHRPGDLVTLPVDENGKPEGVAASRVRPFRGSIDSLSVDVSGTEEVEKLLREAKEQAEAAVQAGQDEAARLITEAKEQAAAILNEAGEQAAAIVAEANKPKK